MQRILILAAPGERLQGMRVLAPKHDPRPCVSRRIGCISEFPRCALGPAPAASCYGNALMECASRAAVSALDLS